MSCVGPGLGPGLAPGLGPPGHALGQPCMHANFAGTQLYTHICAQNVLEIAGVGRQDKMHTSIVEVGSEGKMHNGTAKVGM